MNLRILSILIISLVLTSCSSTSKKTRILASENGTTEFYIGGSDTNVIFVRAIVDNQEVDCNGPFLNITDQQTIAKFVHRVDMRRKPQCIPSPGVECPPTLPIHTPSGREVIVGHNLTIEQRSTERACLNKKSWKGSIASRYTPLAVTKKTGVVIKVPDYISRIEVSLTPITDK